MSELVKTGEVEVDERLERVIWKSLGKKSARRVAEETGVSPEVILRVKRDLLESVDELTIQEKRVKLLADLQDISQRAQDDYDQSPWEFKSGLLNSSIAAVKAVMVELSRMEKADTSKTETLNELRVRELLSLVSAVVEEGVREISDEHGLDEDELFDVFNRKMVEEATKRDLA